MTAKPETDEEMAAIRLSGVVTPYNAPIFLAPYDPTWPEQYAGEARKIRAAPWGTSIVLIALTGWGQEEDRRRAFEAGFDHHLTKPIAPETVESLLRSLNSV